MAIRTIFVDPGDFVTVKVMGNPDVPKNNKEWSYSAVRPFSFSFIPGTGCVTFHDPGLEIKMKRGSGPAKQMNVIKDNR